MAMTTPSLKTGARRVKTISTAVAVAVILSAFPLLHPRRTPLLGHVPPRYRAVVGGTRIRGAGCLVKRTVFAITRA